MVTKNKTTTKQGSATLKYGYMWVEEVKVETTATGKITTVTKHIARDPNVGFFRKIFRV